MWSPEVVGISTRFYLAKMIVWQWLWDHARFMITIKRSNTPIFW
jgi:hypothetical protein